MKQKFILAITSLTLLSQAMAGTRLPENYVDLSGTYINPVCSGLDLVYGSELLGPLNLGVGAKNFKLHIDQQYTGAIQNGQEFNIVTINTYTERDVIWEYANETHHYVTDEISKTVFDSRTGKSMDPGYSWKNGGLNFHHQRIVTNRDILGYRARTKYMTDESIKRVNKKLVVEGTIEANSRERMFWVVPSKKPTKIYHYRCIYEVAED